jgi:hypothetical protein
MNITRKVFLGLVFSHFTCFPCVMPQLVAAQITGMIRLQGTPPPEIRVDMSAFPECVRVHPEPLFTRHYVVSASGGLANVFVYVKKGLEGRGFPVPTAVPLLDQTNAGFYPYVLGIQVGQKFRIRNSEPYMDTVHALPRLNPEFNIAQPLTGMVAIRQFDIAEVLIRVKCEVHPWEFAFIGVVAHPFFAVTGQDGSFRFPPELPPGDYVIEAIHPKAGSREASITVGPGQAQTVDFTFEPKRTAR